MDLYLHYTLFPASDHFLLADLEPERLVPVTRGVKLPTVCQGSCQPGRRRGTESKRKWGSCQSLLWKITQSPLSMHNFPGFITNISFTTKLACTCRF